MLGVWLLASVIMALGAPRPARALELGIPAECGSDSTLRDELAALTAGKPAPPLPRELTITGPDGRGLYRLRLRLDGETRELEDADCRTLLRSAAVIVVAASAPLPSPPPSPATQPSQAEAAAPPSAPAAPSAPPPSVAPAPPPTPRAPPAPPSPAATRGEADVLDPERAEARVYTVGVGVAITDGVIPGVGVALEVSGSIEPEPLGAALAVRYWPRSSTERAGRRVDVAAFGARLAGLVRLAPVVHLAAGLDVAVLRGTGAAGVADRSTDSAWHVAPLVELDAIPWSAGGLRVEVGVSGRVALARPRFIVTNFGEVYRAPSAGADAIIRGVWLFP